MRGVRVLGETRSSHYVCPSCRWRTADGVGSTKRASSRKSRQYPPWPWLLSRHFSSKINSHRQRLMTVRDFSTGVTKPEPPHNTIHSDAFGAAGDNLSCQEEEVLAIIEEAQPGRVLSAFTNPANSQIFAQLPPATFVEALRLISPAYFLEPYKEIYARSNPMLFAKQAKYLRNIFATMSFYLPKIISGRREAGRYLGLAEYTHLLDCARAMGSLELATRLWADMLDDNIEPSVECYNHYMESLVWHNAYFAPDNHHIRSTPFIYRKRSHVRQNYGYRGYRTGPEGTRARVQELFKEMIAKGLQPDTATLIQLMTTHSREWDLEAVQQTLWDTWNVRPDVLALNSHEHPPAFAYSTSSPLHPTADLLVAIAHIYGSNNDVSTALLVVDFFSQSYNIPIPERAWKEIFNWSFVLASDKFRPTTMKRAELQFSTGPAIGVYETMRKEPYFVPASIQALDSLIKLRWYEKTWTKMLDDMRAGRNIFFKSLSKRNEIQDRLESLVVRTKRAAAGGFRQRRLSLANIGESWDYLYPSYTSDGAHWQAYHEFEIQHLRVLIESKAVTRWVKLLLTERGWRDGDLYTRERRYIPDLISEWKDFLPTPVRYPTSGGLVEFKSSSERTRPRVYWVHLRDPELRAQYYAQVPKSNSRDSDVLDSEKEREGEGRNEA